ncbi:hypothetical protein D9613_006193 [Agrocybe pediades]|uniref:CN hydrolase domain-containing protein n=1 Tax=Agrocybe pediades TaxID=84607 RepID=A0A8H4QU01_9AGAR|nr:hypothetical protein D9613_006193 [Agrocybe pediades]
MIEALQYLILEGLMIRIEPKSIDLLCFPEMAFTGYAFGDATAILPHLEQPKTGATSQFCSEIAKLLQCYVLAGYPERLGEDELAEIEASAKQRGDKPLLTPEGNEIHQVGANSAVFYGPDGAYIGGYRKTHLFHIDKSWAKPGTGFTTFTLPSPLQTLSLGICMDLNPQIPEWTSEGGPFEIADYCLEKKSNVLILLNAWLDSRKEPDEERDWSTLNYWAVRTRPLWMDGRDGSDTSYSEGSASPPAAESILDSDGQETVMIVCNRSGQENDNLYAGSSAIFSMQRGAGRPKLLDGMERREEDIRIWNIKVPEMENKAQV